MNETGKWFTLLLWLVVGLFMLILFIADQTVMGWMKLIGGG